MKLIHHAVLTAAALLLTSCGQPSSEQPASLNVPAVYTVNYPLAWMAERIGGESIEVIFPAAPGEDPAFWEPADADITGYQQADLILLNGAGYAAWTATSSLPERTRVNTSAGLESRFISEPGGPAHQHGPQGDAHTHGDMAFTLWLDPLLAIEQAASVRDALIRLQPDNAEKFGAAHAQVAAELQQLHETLRATFSLLTGASIVYSHPVYQYLDARYQLAGFSMHWEPDVKLTADDLIALPETAGIGIVLWESQPLAANRELLREAGYVSVVFDPAANPPAGADYIEIMRTNAANLQEATQ